MEKIDLEEKSRKRTYLIVFFLLFFFFLIFFLKRNSGSSIKYITQKVKRGDLVITVTATGNLQPLNKVEIGVEVSGTIEKIYVDYNDHVKKGQILARLDLSKFEAQVYRAEARLKAAQAELKKAEAELQLAKIRIRRLKRAYRLSHGKVPSKEEIDEAEAKLKIAEAKVESAKAEIFAAKADLKYYRTELSKAIIYSPIDGIVLAKHVEEGQTVAARFQTPVLFTLAEDLRKMELHVDIDEADIGKVKVGQLAEFTVDAYPEKVFRAKVKEVRFFPKIVEGVVTYEAILEVDNPDLLLRPGMTATAKIIVKQIKDAILIPNKALRFRMPRIKKEKRKKSFLSMIIPHPPLRSEVFKEEKKDRIWILKNGRPVEVSIKTGETDGIVTQVLSDNIKPGTEVIVGIKR